MVTKAFRLDNRIAVSDGNRDGNVKDVCVAGACGRADDLIDGEIIAGNLEAVLHEHVGGATIPVFDAAFEVVHTAGGAGDRRFVSGWETEPACWAARREIMVADVTIYGMGFALAGPVNVSSRELTELSVASWCLVSDWVPKTWLATKSHPFEVYISVD